MLISHHDPRLSWHGNVSLERTESYTRPWRIPFPDRALYFEALVQKAGNPAGVRLAFHTDSRRIAGSVVSCGESLLLDLFADGQFVASADLAAAESFAFDGLAAGEKRIELWLPQMGEFALRHLEIDDGAALRPFEDTRPKWITYGSSITHCRAAASPSQTWPAIVARERDLNLLCLGFGGQCHLDILIARTIRDLPADHISICAGINVYGNNSLNARSFRSSLIGFVQVVREKHPDTPLALISPIYSTHRETTPNAVGWTLQDYRNAVDEAASILQDHGDTRIHAINGLDVFGPSLEYLLPDGLHPDAEGCRQMGANFLRVAGGSLFA